MFEKSKQFCFYLSLFTVCEPQHTDLRYGVGFPIDRELPPEPKFSWSCIPSKGRSRSKTHTFSCNLYLLAWFSLMAMRVKMTQIYHGICSFQRSFAIIHPSAVPSYAENSTLGWNHQLAGIHLIAPLR